MLSRRIVLVLASAWVCDCAYMLSEVGLLPRASADELAQGPSRAAVQASGPADCEQEESTPAQGGCLEHLRSLGFEFSLALPPSRDLAGCGMQQGVVIRTGPTGLEYRPAVRVSCPYALGLQSFEQQISEAAAAYLAEPVRSVRIMGSYGCRTIRGGRIAGRLSQHAFGNALDVGEFRTGHSRASVLQDFRADSAAGRFLRDVAERLRRAGPFERVLDPDYDAAHHNHFHVEGRQLPGE